MKIGSPPTAPKARAGLLTPPGMSCFARANAAWLLDRSMRPWEVIKFGAGTRRGDASLRSRVRRSRRTRLDRDREHRGEGCGLFSFAPRHPVPEVLLPAGSSGPEVGRGLRDP